MVEQRRRFSEEFKREAVRMAFGGDRPVAEVARELEGLAGHGASVAAQPCGRAGRAERAGGGESSAAAGSLRDVREERDILKKALAIFSDRRP